MDPSNWLSNISTDRTVPSWSLLYFWLFKFSESCHYQQNQMSYSSCRDVFVFKYGGSCITRLEKQLHQQCVCVFMFLVIVLSFNMFLPLYVWAEDSGEGVKRNILQMILCCLYSRGSFITTMHLMLVKQAALSWRILWEPDGSLLITPTWLWLLII